MKTVQVQNLSKMSKEKFKKFFRIVHNILVDCDGVLWRSEKRIRGTPKVITKFRDLDKNVLYCTNNSLKSRAGFAEKAQKFKIIADASEIIGTSYLIAHYLKQNDFHKKVYVVGSHGMAEELNVVGIKNTGVGEKVFRYLLKKSRVAYMSRQLMTSWTHKYRFWEKFNESKINTVLFHVVLGKPHALSSHWDDEYKMMKLDEDIGAVVVGFDQHISYPKMMWAASYVNKPGCYFLGTDRDCCWELKKIPDNPRLAPGAGTILKTIELASGKEAMVVGKPNEYMKDYLLNERRLNPERTLLIGDRLDTDILFGNRCGFHTLLVLTGATNLSHLNTIEKNKSYENIMKTPHYYVDKLTDLLEPLDNFYSKN